jgi:hypothetical protein
VLIVSTRLKTLLAGDAMDGEFETIWQRRWASLADRLELALQNRAYRFLLGAATLVLVMSYVVVASRMAEPPRWLENSLVVIDPATDLDPALGVWQADAVNRSLARLEKLAWILSLKPHLLQIRPTIEDVTTPYGLEIHVLRLWLDELRGFNFEGMYDVTSAAVARSIVAIAFNDDRLLADLPPADANWFPYVRTIKETCSVAHPREWSGLCAILENSVTPNPLSLTGWLTRQLVVEAEGLTSTQRVDYLRALVRRSADRELLKFESLERWPKLATDYGETIRAIVTGLAPERAKRMNFMAFSPSMQMPLSETNVAPKIPLNANETRLEVGLLIVTSCRIPQLASLLRQISNVDARELVWARRCDTKTGPAADFVPATTAQEFAEKNPDAAFAQLGIPEIKVALRKGWLDSKIDIAKFVIESREPNSQLVASQLRPQSEEWNARAQAFRVKAPVEILKLVRLRPI